MVDLKNSRLRLTQGSSVYMTSNCSTISSFSCSELDNWDSRLTNHIRQFESNRVSVLNDNKNGDSRQKLKALETLTIPTRITIRFRFY